MYPLSTPKLYLYNTPSQTAVTLPTIEHLPENEECWVVERFSEDIRNLLVGIHISNVDSTCVQELLEMIVFQSDMFCSRRELGGLSHCNA